MLHHLVLFKFKDKPSDEQMSAVEEGLMSMKDGIPQIQAISCGEDVNKGERGGFVFGLSVQVENQDALKAYLEHPVHKAVVKEKIDPLHADIVAVDYFA